MVLLIIILSLFLLYSILIIYYWLAWRAIPDFIPTPIIPNTRISVIIPARNEEKNIEDVLMGLVNQTYPKHLFEIIVVNDNSTDRTAELVEAFNNVKLINLETVEINSYKKKAIETGIMNAQQKQKLY